MEKSRENYWKTVLGLVRNILIVWFVVSYGCGIIFAGALDSIKLGGYPLGFWFAQQGAIYIFVALIFFYSNRMAKIDEEYDVAE
ncbi:MAG: DUF4212 domain-containing protein [Denitrovibrio sp.]|nr:MAG: DUF4212 domain-containing protein [Denitrovibrio sp.]